jgi:O-antigen ligase
MSAILAFGTVDRLTAGVVEVAVYLSTITMLLVAWRRRCLVRLPASLWPLLGLCLLVLLQWLVPTSQYPAATLDGLAGLLAAVCVYFLGLMAFADAANYRLAGFVLWGFAAGVAVEAIFQRFTAGGFIYWVRDATQDAMPTGPFTYHNYYAAYVELILPVVVAGTVALARSGRHWTAWVRAGMVPAALLSSFAIAVSRWGVVAMFAEMLLAAAIYALGPRRWSPTRRPIRFALGLVLGGIGFSALAGWGAFAHRFASLSLRQASVADRWRVAISCLHIWRAYPWLGSGLGTFPSVYPAFRLFDNGLIFLQAHNDWLQLLSETGCLGLALALAFLFLLAREAWQSARAAQPRPHVVSLKLAALVGCAGFLVHCAADFVAHSVGNLLLFSVLAAMAAARAKMPATPGRSRLGASAQQQRHRALPVEPAAIRHKLREPRPWLDRHRVSK